MSGLISMRCYDTRNNQYDGSLCGINAWVSKPDLWSQQMKEEQIAQKPGPWFFEEDPTSCSPVSDSDDINQFLNYRVGVQNVTQSVEVPTSEHVAEIVGRQGCKIKALRAKTNTYIKTPIRGEDPIFVVTGRPEDVQEAKREIECAADHFTQIRASRRHSQVLPGAHAPGQVTIYVRVPLRVVGLVVGPKGATIKRIQQDTHTYIITPSREREPVFEVTGLPHNVEAARKEIETHIFQRTGNLPETEHDSPGQYVGASLLQAQQQAAAAQKQQSALYRKAFASSNLFNQMSNDLPFGIDSSLGLDALLRSFPSMRNSLTPDSLQGFGRTSIGGATTMAPAKQSRPSLGGQSTKMDLPTYDYWGNNNSINDIMENEILSRNYDALSAWSSLGLDKEKREESPINGLMSLKSAPAGFGIMQSIWTDHLNLSPGSLASASASPASSSCDHNDHTLVPING